MIAAMALEQVGRIPFGEKAKYRDPDEQKYMIDTFGDYFAAINVTDISPGWGLALGLSVYSLARINEPEVKARMAGMLHKFKEGAKARREARNKLAEEVAS